MSLPLEVTPTEVQRLIDAGTKVRLIDVREPEEFAICKIEGADLVPMNSVPAVLQTLDAQADEAILMVFCHHGMRSLNVVNWLRGHGVENCQSISGGIDLWSRAVDSSVPRY